MVSAEVINNSNYNGEARIGWEIEDQYYPRKYETLKIVGGDGKVISEFAPGSYSIVSTENNVADYSNTGTTVLAYEWHEGEAGEDGYGLAEGGKIHGQVVIMGKNGEDLKIVEVYRDTEGTGRESRLQNVVVLPGGDVVVAIVEELKTPTSAVDSDGYTRYDYEYSQRLVKIRAGQDKLDQASSEIKDSHLFVGYSSQLGLVFKGPEKIGFIDPENMTRSGELAMPVGSALGYDNYRDELVTAGEDGVYRLKDGKWNLVAPMPRGLEIDEWGSIKFAPNGTMIFGGHITGKDRSALLVTGVVGADKKVHLLEAFENGRIEGESWEKWGGKVDGPRWSSAYGWTGVTDDGIVTYTDGREFYRGIAQNEKTGLMAGEIKFGRVKVGSGAFNLQSTDGATYEIIVGVQPEGAPSHWQAVMKKLLEKGDGQVMVIFNQDLGSVRLGAVGVKDKLDINLVGVAVGKK